MLISLIIKERKNLLSDKTFLKKIQENRLREHFIREKKLSIMTTVIF
jgi:hypothetical protein